MYFYRAKAKKRKTGELPSSSYKPGSATPELVIPESQVETAKDQADEIIEPPSSDNMNIQTCVANEMGGVNLPSPNRASSPAEPAENVALSFPQAAIKVTTTEASIKNPEPSNTLKKHALPSLEDLGEVDLYEAYLTRLSINRDMEVSMVNTLKKKYEVRSSSPLSIYHM